MSGAPFSNSEAITAVAIGLREGMKLVFVIVYRLSLSCEERALLVRRAAAVSVLLK
jgi:hypothetical protein